MTTNTLTNGMLGVVLAAAMMFACGGPDPTQLLGGAGGSASTSSGGTSSGASAPDTTPTQGGGSETGAGGGTAPSPSTANGADAGGGPMPGASEGGAVIDAGTASANAFTGASPYAAGTGASTRKDDHPNGGNPAGVACFSCHGKGAPQMVMGGTVYADGAGTIPLAQAEVRLVAGGAVHTAFTNSDGNFFVLGSSLSGAAKVGVRNAGGMHAMTGAPASGDCNGCHDGTTTARIHLP